MNIYSNYTKKYNVTYGNLIHHLFLKISESFVFSCCLNILHIWYSLYMYWSIDLLICWGQEVDTKKILFANTQKVFFANTQSVAAAHGHPWGLITPPPKGRFLAGAWAPCVCKEDFWMSAPKLNLNDYIYECDIYNKLIYIQNIQRNTM